jgi:uncharacterized membrane protein YciS (DUF1049 family)
MMKLLGWLVFAIVCVIALTLYMKNDAQVAIDLVFYQFEAVSIGMVMAAAFVVGSLLGLLSASMIFVRMKTTEIATRRKLAQSEKELGALRSNVG